MQGSKHLLAPSGATLKVLKLIKEDHFACNHEDVLSSLGPTGFMREQEQAEPGSRLDHFSTPETSRPTSSRLSDYSLVKEQFAPAKESKFAPAKERLYLYAAEPYGFVDESFFHPVSRARGGGS